LVGSGGSIGANYCEATEGESKKDKIRILWKESQELLLIFSKIIRSSKNKTLEN